MKKLDEALNFAFKLTNVPPAEIVQKTRRPNVVRARRLAAKYLREVYKMSLPRIAIVLGGYHHTAIIDMCRKCDKEYREVMGL